LSAFAPHRADSDAASDRRGGASFATHGSYLNTPIGMSGAKTPQPVVTHPTFLNNAMRIGIYCSSSNQMPPAYYEAARELGEWVGRNGHSLVYGGIACGMMETVAQAVHGAGGTVYGVVPAGLRLKAGASEAIDVTFHCQDLSDRKTWLVQESDILVVLPGSIGTLDETFSTLAAYMVGMHQKPTVFYNVAGFYDGLFAFLHSLDSLGVVNRPWDTLFSVAGSLQQLTEIIEKTTSTCEK